MLFCTPQRYKVGKKFGRLSTCRHSIGVDWYPVLKIAVSDDSELGNLLSLDESNTVLNTLNSDESKATLRIFLDRWNNTATAWENGTLNELAHTGQVISLSALETRVEQYFADTEQAKLRGFDSIFDEYNNAVRAYVTADEENRVHTSTCTTFRILSA